MSGHLEERKSGSVLNVKQLGGNMLNPIGTSERCNDCGHVFMIITRCSIFRAMYEIASWELTVKIHKANCVNNRVRAIIHATKKA